MELRTSSSHKTGCQTWRLGVPLSHPLTGWDESHHPERHVTPGWYFPQNGPCHLERPRHAHRVQVPPEDGLRGESTSREWSLGPGRTSDSDGPGPLGSFMQACLCVRPLNMQRIKYTASPTFDPPSYIACPDHISHQHLFWMFLRFQKSELP